MTALVKKGTRQLLLHSPNSRSPAITRRQCAEPEIPGNARGVYEHVCDQHRRRPHRSGVHGNARPRRPILLIAEKLGFTSMSREPHIDPAFLAPPMDELATLWPSRDHQQYNDERYEDDLDPPMSDEERLERNLRRPSDQPSPATIARRTSARTNRPAGSNRRPRHQRDQRRR